METQNLLVLVAVAIGVVAFASWIIGSRIRRRRRARENVGRLGVALRLTEEPRGFFRGWLKPGPLLGGVHGGRRFEFFQHRDGEAVLNLLQATLAAKSELAFALKIPAQSALIRSSRGRFSVNLPGILGALGQDVSVGDPAFDAAWTITSNQPEVVKGVLGAELRQAIMALHSQGGRGTYRLDGAIVSYGEHGPFHDDARWQRFAAVAPVLNALAVAIEASAAPVTDPR